MTDTQPLSVIIVSWRVRPFLERCLASLRSTALPLRIIVVDNNSRDGSVELVQKTFPECELIANSTNRGFAAAVNQGLALVHDGHALLLNPDCRVLPGSLEAAVAALESEQDIGVLGCLLRNEDGSIQPSIRRFPSFLDQAMILLKLHRLVPAVSVLRSYFASDLDYTKDQDVDQVKGAFFLISRNALRVVGHLDEAFWIWFEEVDYCRRVKDSGMVVRYLSSAEVVHAGGESFRSVWTVSRQKAFCASLLRYFRKHRPLWEYFGLAVLVPLSYFLALLSTPVSLVKAKIPTPHG